MYRERDVCVCICAGFYIVRVMNFCITNKAEPPPLRPPPLRPSMSICVYVNCVYEIVCRRLCAPVRHHPPSSPKASVMQTAV